MTWKIHRNTQMTGEKPVLWLHDPKVELHMVTELAGGITHLFIGGKDKDDAELYISFSDPEEDSEDPTSSGAVLEYARFPSTFQLKVVSSVLRTLNCGDGILHSLWADARRRDRDDALQG